MNRIGYLLSLSLLIQTVALGVSFAECHTEEEAIDWLKEKLSTNEKIDKNIISIVRLEKNVHVKAVQRSWWTVSEHIVTAAKEQEVDISSPFARSAAIIKQGTILYITSRSNLQKIQNLINSNRNDWFVISPAFQWAQGMNDVCHTFYFRHRLM